MKNKLRAALVHLLISSIIVSTIFALVLLVCYPQPYFEATGVGNLLLLIATVDICLGPIVTFIIFDSAKRWLKAELAFIAIIQFSALVYGAVSVFNGRPVYLVFDDNGFTLVSAYQIPQVELDRMKDTTLSISGPKLVGARIPATREERKKYIAEAMKEHVDLPRMVQYHVPYQSMVDAVKSKMLSLDILSAKGSPTDRRKINTLLEEVTQSSRIPLADLAFVPMTDNVTSLTVIVNRSDAKVVKVLPFNASTAVPN